MANHQNLPAPPLPPDSLLASGLPPFLSKTYDMVENSSSDSIVSWSSANNSFVVWNAHAFSRDLLPRFFKHSNFSSFVRQLNTYGFKKIDPDRWEFANERFLRGQKHLLKNIQRRKSASQIQAQTLKAELCVEVGKYGAQGEIQSLKRDKTLLLVEVVRLRQQQQAVQQEMSIMSQRRQTAEQRHQRMMAFLTKAIQNPTFLGRFAQLHEQTKRLACLKKRRRLPSSGKSIAEVSSDAGESESSVTEDNQSMDSDIFPSDADLRKAFLGSAMDASSGHFKALVPQMEQSDFNTQLEGLDLEIQSVQIDSQRQEGQAEIEGAGITQQGSELEGEEGDKSSVVAKYVAFPEDSPQGDKEIVSLADMIGMLDPEENDIFWEELFDVDPKACDSEGVAEEQLAVGSAFSSTPAPSESEERWESKPNVES